MKTQENNLSNGISVTGDADAETLDEVPVTAEALADTFPDL